MAKMKFNFSQIAALSNDLETSKKAIAVIARRLLVQHLRVLRSSVRSFFIPRATGRLQRTFGFTSPKGTKRVETTFGFLKNKKTAVSAIVAGNVLQKGQATLRKRKYLWIPLPFNRNPDGSANIKPRALLDGDGFIKKSKAGNVIAFQRVGNGIRPMFVLKKSVTLGAPIPLEDIVPAAARGIARELPIAIAQVIEAKQKFLGVINA